MAPPPHRTQDHHIPLDEGKTPPYEPLRPLNKEKMKALREYLETNEKRGWIHASTSPAGAPIHFVNKKDAGLRLCVDYRQLNEMTIKDRTPLPLIGESLGKLSSITIYTKLDIRDAYYNLRIAKGDEWKTAFCTRYGLYEYCVMPFGLTNTLASFQRWMNEILSNYLDIFCVAYLDNILVFSPDEETHWEHIRAILTRVRDTGLTLKVSKCELHTKETEYLGYVISPQGLRMDEEKIRTIRDWKEPTNVKGIQSVLGFANVYRRFIRDYSKITMPLSSLTRKEKAWEWGDKQQEALETLKEAMITEPILQHLDPGTGHYHRNGCIKLCHRSNLLPTRREKDPTSSSILLKETQGPGTQLRYPRQRTTGDRRRTAKMGYLLQDNGTQNHDSHESQRPRILEN